MSKSTFDAIRIKPRTQEYLERNFASSGEIYFNQTTESLKVFNGTTQGGIDLARGDLANVSNDVLLQKLNDAGFESSGNASISVSDIAPTDPIEGQLWFETSTGILYVYYEDVNSGQWVQPAANLIGSPSSGLNFKTFAVSGQNPVSATDAEDTVTFVAGSNISLNTNSENKTITISASAGESGIVPNSFTSILVPGQATITADSDTDNLVFSSGSGISVTTNASNNTITITNTSLAEQLTNFSSLTDAVSSSLTIDQFYLPAITRLNVTNLSASAYRFDQYGVTNNPQIYVIGATTIAFNLNVPNHPFLIQDGTGENYNTGLIHVTSAGVVSTGSAAQGKTSGTLYWKIPSTISGTYRYQCSAHLVMVGSITVKNIVVV